MIATIDSGRAARARAIFAAALTLPPTTTPEDEAQWRALEAAQPLYGPFHGPKTDNKPHPLSAYAHLPMRGICYGTSDFKQHVPNVAAKKRAIALWPEPKREKYRSPVSGKVVKDAKVEVKVSAPHPRSACKELPLSGLGLDRTPGTYDLFSGALDDAVRLGRKAKATHKWTLSAAEKATLEGRPLRYVTEAA